MAVYFDFSPVDNRSTSGTVQPVMRGSSARHLVVATPGASAWLMNGGDEWQALGQGFVRISGDSAAFVRFCAADDAVDAESGAAWNKAADQELFLSYVAGDQIKVASA